MDNNIENKVIIITGASSGLGEAAARHLSAKGARVVLGARRTPRIESLADDLGKNGGALAVTTDVTDVEQVKALAQAAVDKYGRIDVLINNAGLMPQSRLDHYKVEEWNQMIDVNIKGVLYGIAAVLPFMEKQQSGHIINVASVAGHTVHPGSAVYSATKHAVRTISEGLRQEVKPYNLRTTIVSPGAVDTELPETISVSDISERMNNFYDEHAVPADSFARAVAYAISQPEELDINEILYRPTSQKG